MQQHSLGYPEKTQKQSDCQQAAVLVRRGRNIQQLLQSSPTPQSAPNPSHQAFMRFHQHRFELETGGKGPCGARLYFAQASFFSSTCARTSMRPSDTIIFVKSVGASRQLLSSVKRCFLTRPVERLTARGEATTRRAWAHGRKYSLSHRRRLLQG